MDLDGSITHALGDSVSTSLLDGQLPHTSVINSDHSVEPGPSSAPPAALQPPRDKSDAILAYLECLDQSNQTLIKRVIELETNCNKFYCNLTFYKLNTYLILTSACLVLWSKNISTNKNFLRNILVTRGDPFVCACPHLRSSHCRQKIVESSSLYFWSPENKLCGEVGWVYPCEDKVSI